MFDSCIWATVLNPVVLPNVEAPAKTTQMACAGNIHVMKFYGENESLSRRNSRNWVLRLSHNVNDHPVFNTGARSTAPTFGMKPSRQMNIQKRVVG